MYDTKDANKRYCFNISIKYSTGNIREWVFFLNIWFVSNNDNNNNNVLYFGVGL